MQTGRGLLELHLILPTVISSTTSMVVDLLWCLGIKAVDLQTLLVGDTKRHTSILVFSIMLQVGPYCSALFLSSVLSLAMIR